MAARFGTGFLKTAKAGGLLGNASALDRHGLKMLAIAPAYQGYKAIKNKDKGEGAIAATELGGLAMLHRAVNLAHK